MVVNVAVEKLEAVFRVNALETPGAAFFFGIRISASA
jgi:hypothetical protein